ILNEKEGSYEQDYWNRPGNDKLRGGGDAGRRARGDPEPGGRANDAFGGGTYEDGGTPGWTSGEAPSGNESREHGVLDQTIHGAALRRSGGRNEARALQGGKGEPRRCAN